MTTRIGAAIAAAVLVALTAMPSQAAITIREYGKIIEARRPRLMSRFDILVQHLGGVVEGLEWANAYLQRRGQKPIYCRPAGIRLGMTEVISMIEAEMRVPSIRNLEKYRPDTPIEGVLMTALRARFPCPK
jgi:hypothetical protein